jgi:hypothetical protein
MLRLSADLNHFFAGSGSQRKGSVLRIRNRTRCYRDQ